MAGASHLVPTNLDTTPPVPVPRGAGASVPSEPRDGALSRLTDVSRVIPSVAWIP